MTKVLLLLTVLMTTMAAAQGNTAVQRLIFRVSHMSKAGFSHVPVDRLPDAARPRFLREARVEEAPVATTTFSWISTSDDKKVSFQTSGSSRILILASTSPIDRYDVSASRAMAAEVTVSAAGKSGSIDLEICREAAVNGGTENDDISRILSTLTSS